MKRIVLPTLLGIEAITAQELIDLGHARERITVADGQVTLTCEAADQVADTVAQLNFNLRTAERVLLVLGSFPANSFEELFDRTCELTWHDFLDPGFRIEVNGYSRKSKLFGIPACQRLIKKAIVKRLLAARNYPDGIVPENEKNGINRIQFSIVEDQVTMMLDTTGDGLHKRGYRPLTHAAPIRETLAAAILKISLLERFQAQGECLFDPFCGSGTFPIEAALILTNTAPGIKRHFLGESYHLLGTAPFDRQREYAKRRSFLYHAGETEQLPRICLKASDISATAVEQARKNSERAGVAELIDYTVRDIHKLKRREMIARCQTERILLITNPPYGERLATPEEVRALEQAIAKLSRGGPKKLFPGMRLSVITANDRFESEIGYRADKRRKLYNGMIRCTLYHYFRN